VFLFTIEQQYTDTIKDWLRRMFSTKVIYAIETVAELSGCRPNRQGRRIMKRQDLESVCSMEVTISRPVLDQLSKHGYVSRLTTGYALQRELNEISLYEFIELFHGGVVIGELLDSLFLQGEFRQRRCYRKLAAFEEEVKNKLTDQFRRVRISDLVEMENAAEKLQGA